MWILLTNADWIIAFVFFKYSAFSLFLSSLMLMSGFYVTSSSLPFTRSWGRQTEFWKFIENSSFDQKQKFFRHFAQYDTTIQVGQKKNLGVIGTLNDSSFLVTTNRKSTLILQRTYQLLRRSKRILNNSELTTTNNASLQT